MTGKPISLRSPTIASALAERQDTVLLAVGLCLLAGVSAARFVFPDPTNGVTLFAVIPVGLFGLIFGIRGGLAAAAMATSSFASWAILQHADIQAFGYLTRASGLLVTGVGVGYLSDLSYRSAQAARATSEQLQMVLRSAAALVYVKDRNGSFRLLSQPARTEPVGDASPEELPAPLSEEFRRHDLEAMEGGTPIAVEENAQLEDGIHSYLSTKYPLLDSEGTPVGVCSVSSDITAQKRVAEMALAQAELNGRAKELERSNAELAHFAQAAAHDLSEPLRTVSGYLGLLARRHGDELEHDADEYLRIALHGTRRMQDLIEALLHYSRIDRGELRPTIVDCKELIDDVMDGVRLAIEETGAVVRVHSVPTIEGDPNQLGSLFQNMISNAMKFVEGRPPVIDITASREEDGWRFAIADNGIGIDRGRVDEVFDMFRQLHSRHEYGGSGIGLAMCRRIVERHGGRIWVESVPGEGSTFYFTVADRIPVKAPPPASRLPEVDRETIATNLDALERVEPVEFAAPATNGRISSIRSTPDETLALAGAPSHTRSRRSRRRRSA
jgi:signal transduction histidine kinase